MYIHVTSYKTRFITAFSFIFSSNFTQDYQNYRRLPPFVNPNRLYNYMQSCVNEVKTQRNDRETNAVGYAN